jgi:hypothetical protein
MSVEEVASEPVEGEIEATPEMISAAMDVVAEHGIREATDDEMRVALSEAFKAMWKEYRKFHRAASSLSQYKSSSF